MTGLKAKIEAMKYWQDIVDHPEIREGITAREAEEIIQGNPLCAYFRELDVMPEHTRKVCEQCPIQKSRDAACYMEMSPVAIWVDKEEKHTKEGREYAANTMLGYVRKWRPHISAEEAKEWSIKVWEYLAEHPDVADKGEIPFEIWTVVENMLNRCPLCEWRNSMRYFKRGINFCENCPLAAAKERCTSRASAWGLWMDALSNTARETSAKRILEIVTEWDTEKME